jgi:membrane protein YdbS with pleckstrin-like domain
MFDPRIARHLIADQGEVVIDEVRKHWAALVFAILELLLGLVVLLVAFVVPPQAWWLPAIIGGAVALHATWRILERRMDRFVITNMRVFRVHGILTQNIATMPLSRILDISVHKPIVGRVFGYGHFIFESAAQAQGLREIRFVGSPDERGLTIQRVIQQAGLRGFNPQQPFAGTGRTTTPAPASTPADPPTQTEPEEEAWWREETRPLPPIPPPPPLPSFDPDRTSTAPINLPR